MSKPPSAPPPKKNLLFCKFQHNLRFLKKVGYLGGGAWGGLMILTWESMVSRFFGPKIALFYCLFYEIIGEVLNNPPCRK